MRRIKAVGREDRVETWAVFRWEEEGRREDMRPTMLIYYIIT